MDKKISELPLKETIEGEERIVFAYQGGNGAFKASSFVSKTEYEETIGDISSALDQINGGTGTVTPVGYVKMGNTVR